MSIEANNAAMYHCPNCDGICLVSQSEIDVAHTAEKIVEIICHQCESLFSIDKNKNKNNRIARLAKLKIINCPLCKKQVTIPQSLIGKETDSLSCPLCKGEFSQNMMTTNEPTSHKETSKKQNIDQDAEGLSTLGQALPRSNAPISYAPLYFLFLICLGALIFWMHQSGQITMEQWVKFME